MQIGVIETAFRSFVVSSSEDHQKLLRVAVDELRAMHDGDWRIGAMTVTLLHPDSRKGERVLIVVAMELWAS